MASFSDAAFFTDAFSVNAFDFGTATTSDGKTGTGGIDPGEGLKHRTIVKPTGLQERRATARPTVDERIDDSSAIRAEVAQQLAREFGQETEAIIAAQQARTVAELSAAEVAFEIGALLRKKIRTEEDEVLLLLLLAAAA